MQSLSNSDRVDEVLSRLKDLNNQSSAILSHSEESMRSLQSIASSLSRKSSNAERSRSVQEKWRFPNEPSSPLFWDDTEGSGYYWSASCPPAISDHLGTHKPERLKDNDSVISSEGSGISSPLPSISEGAGHEEYARYCRPQVTKFRHFVSIKTDNIRFDRRSTTTSRLATRPEDSTAENENPEDSKLFSQDLYTWSCSAMRSIHDAFYCLGEDLCCGYCGAVVAAVQSLRAEEYCRHHLIAFHQFQECMPGRKFSRLNRFHQHLQSAHGAIYGEWSQVVEKACMEPGFGPVQDPFGDWELPVNVAADMLESFWKGLRHLDSHCQMPWLPRLIDEKAPFEDSFRDLGTYRFVGKMRLAGLCKLEMDLLSRMMTNFERDWETASKWEALKFVKERVISSAERDFQQRSGPGIDIGLLQNWTRVLQEDPVRGISGESPSIEAIKTQSYNASLLGQWTGTRDRVNRWLLHSLGCSEEQVQLHRSMLFDPTMSAHAWSRFVLKYWFMDDSALGIELEPSASVGAVQSPNASSDSLWSGFLQSGHFDERVLLDIEPRVTAT